MDIQKIDLRRGDFEGMHPKAKLFGFDEDKKLYTGDGVESINDQWTTWCACIGMLHLDVKEAQAVPEGFVLVPKKLNHEQAVKISDDENFFETYQTILAESDTSEDSAVILIQTAHKAMIEAQEPVND